MHCLRADSSIDARSSAVGRRKATFADAGPQARMFAWFQRSTHIRRTWAEDVLWPHADTSETASRRQEQLRAAPVRREVAVEALAAELSLRLLIMDCFPRGGL
jgi:hypothetical protein